MASKDLNVRIIYLDKFIGLSEQATDILQKEHYIDIGVPFSLQFKKTPLLYIKKYDNDDPDMLNTIYNKENDVVQRFRIYSYDEFENYVKDTNKDYIELTKKFRIYIQPEINTNNMNWNGITQSKYLNWINTIHSNISTRQLVPILAENKDLKYAIKEYYVDNVDLSTPAEIIN